ncbi:MAG: hypothetical protein K1000chlam3_00210 [Chlamydiae bacterium]|nr:hypothetical protein [Chlamydiota bacterium]
MEHKWHAEDVSWPLKKTGKLINGKSNKIVEVDFSPEKLAIAA